jgi:hypothetical protein
VPPTLAALNIAHLFQVVSRVRQWGTVPGSRWAPCRSPGAETVRHIAGFSALGGAANAWGWAAERARVVWEVHGDHPWGHELTAD